MAKVTMNNRHPGTYAHRFYVEEGRSYIGLIPMLRRLAFLGGFVYCSITVTGASCPSARSSAEQSHPLLSGRREHLLRYMKNSPDPKIAEELAQNASQVREVRKALLAAFIEQATRPRNRTDFPYSPGMPYWMADGLTRAGTDAASDLVDALKTIKPAATPGLYSELVGTLGRIGPPGKCAAPYLRKVLAEHPPPEVRVVIRLALANLGDVSKENLAAIRADLNADRNVRTRQAAARALVLIRPRDWFSEEMIQLMAESTSSEGLEVVVALGVLGERARDARGRLDEALREAMGRYDGLWLVYALAISRIEPRTREANLRRFCEHVDEIGDCFGGWLVLSVWSDALVLVDGPTVQQLARFVDDPDIKVSRGAIWLLRFTGLSAREAVPALLRFLRSRAEGERRAYAAYALASIADASHLAALDAMLREEKSEAVRAELAHSIDWIKTLQPTVGHEVPNEFLHDWVLIARYRAMKAMPAVWKSHE